MTKYELQKLAESGVFSWEAAAQKRLVAISAEVKKTLTKALADSQVSLCAEMSKVFEGTSYSFDPEAETSSDDSDSEEEKPPTKTKPKARPRPSEASKGSGSDAPKVSEVAPPVAALPEDGNASTTVASSTGREGTQAEVASGEAPAASTAPAAASTEGAASAAGAVA